MKTNKRKVGRDMIMLRKRFELGDENEKEWVVRKTLRLKGIPWRMTDRPL